MRIITIQNRARCVRHLKIVLKSSFLRCYMARYYGGICINHAVLKRISSKKIFRTVVPPPGEGALDGFPRLIPKEALFIAGGI